MVFTQAEFDTMVYELIYKETPCNDMLCHIAEKVLKSSVSRWCYCDESLQGRNFENDVMQDIYLRLMQVTVTHFLLKDGPGGSVNNDPEGFEDWMFEVAKNVKRQFSKKVRAIDFHGDGAYIEYKGGFVSEDIEDSYCDAQERINELSKAVDIVLSADISIYKTLTWLAQCVLMLSEDITKIKSNDIIVGGFENKTLNEMYGMILVTAKRIPWLVISDKQNERIQRALSDIWRDNITYGETLYKSFFMKNKGVVSGKKSVSDWVNRINGLIKKKS